MAFSSFPAIYFDHPNLQQFHQQQDHQQHGSGERSQIQLPPLTVGAVGGDGGSGSVPVRSMIDLARLAQAPLPEVGLKCPRCDSSNTKFCYYNNYNLSQPRYMCKSCRRYWTKGGALRNVPVGGGCRKNKKTKNSSSSSKSTTVSSDMQMGANSNGTTTPCITDTSNFPQFPRIMDASSHNLTRYSGGPIGSNLGTFPVNMGFSLGNNIGGNANGLSSAGGGAETWRLSLIRGYTGEGNGASSSSMIGNQQLGSMATSSAGVSRNTNGESEENPADNITREFYINSDVNAQFWSDHENPWIGF